jgi:hypothetical protein
MSVEESVQYSLEELLVGAQDNFSAVILVTMAYLKKYGLQPSDYLHFVGEAFADKWSKGIDAKQMAEGSAVNWVSVGGKVVELGGDETRSTLVLCGWPSKELLEDYGAKVEEADAAFEIMRPIANRMGFEYEWKREGKRVVQHYMRK